MSFIDKKFSIKTTTFFEKCLEKIPTSTERNIDLQFVRTYFRYLTLIQRLSSVSSFFNIHAHSIFDINVEFGIKIRTQLRFS